MSYSASKKNKNVRANPLHSEYDSQVKSGRAVRKPSYAKKEADSDNEKEDVLPSDISAKIMAIAREQTAELTKDMEEIDTLQVPFEEGERDPQVDNEGYVQIDVDMDEEEERLMEMFLAPKSENVGIRTLADMITKKLEEKKTTGGLTVAEDVQEEEDDENCLDLAGMIQEKIREKKTSSKTEEESAYNLPAKAIESFRECGEFLKRYKSGKLPKIFKIVSQLEHWEEALYLTAPMDWTPNAMREATKIFISSSYPRMCVRFLSLVLLPAIRIDIAENKKLNVHYYEALKKALFKPDAFMKGILLPLIYDDCTLREAIIIGSVVKKLSIPVVHSAVVLKKLCETPNWTSIISYFVGIFLNKKYALPYSVLNIVVRYFDNFVHDTRKLPVVWYKSLLFFVQRYKFELNVQQKNIIFNICKAHTHHLITSEIRRELVQSNNIYNTVSNAPMEMD